MKSFLQIVLFVALIPPISAQDLWQYFTADDFAKRRSVLMDKIGDGVAVFLGAELPEAFIKFRQDNTFYYLTGVDAPDAILIIDGLKKTTHLVVPSITSGDIRNEARIVPGLEAAAKYKVDWVSSRSNFSSILESYLSPNHTVFLYLGTEETAEMSPDRSGATRLRRLNDPWDGRIPKETNFANLVKTRFPGVAIKDIAPVLHAMRWVKDEKEIAVIRECGRIGALGFNEAMKITRPGLYEYQVVAACDFYYQYSGQQNPAFFAIAASGEQALDWHYNANNHVMKSGDVILLDYAPDYHYYVTDITRTWPVNGKFTADQKKMYLCIVEYREKAIKALKPGVTYEDLLAIGKAVYEKHGYGKLWPNYAGHFVGMAVHDVGQKNGQAFVPGVVFNLEPIIEDKIKKVHFRLEDTIVITKDGAEVLTGLTPVEPSDIEKVIAEKGIFE
ncbi:aminopeptidase P family protein [bacterium]|nr:MAG: aminopeptidase P family protein [bacterium]